MKKSIFSPAVAGAVALLLCGCYLYQAREYAQGDLCAPLDDAYIYFQYAREIASGHIFQYNGTGERTLGATSVLYTVLLAVLSFLGAGEWGLPWVAYFLGAVAFGLTAAVGVRWGEGVFDKAFGWAFGSLIALQGLLVLSALSGMETAIFTFFLVAAAASLFAWERGEAGSWTPALFLAAMAAFRPEGGLLAGLALLAFLGIAVRKDWPEGSEVPGWAQGACVSAGILFQPLLCRLISGHWTPNGSVVKGLFAQSPGLKLPEYLFIYGYQVWDMISGLFLGVYRETPIPRGTTLPPLILLFMVVGLVAAVVKTGLKGRIAYFVTSLWLVAGLGLSCALVSARYRYQLPYLPLVLFFALSGVKQVSPFPGGALLFKGVAAFWIALSAVTGLMYSNLYASNCLYTQTLEKQVGIWLKEHTAETARAVVHDAGAIRWFGHRFVYDAWGLTTNFTTRPRAQGGGAVFEAFVRHVPQALPEYFAIFPANLPDFIESGLAGKELARFAGSGTLFLPLGTDNPIVISQADWSGALDGLRPFSPEWAESLPLAVLNTADIESEQEARYRAIQGVSNMVDVEHLLTKVRRLPTEGLPEKKLLDGGRLIHGGREEFTLYMPEASAPKTLIVRVDEAASTRTVHVEGCEPVHLDFPAGKTWREAAMNLQFQRPLRGRKLKVTITGEPGAKYWSYHYWVFP